MGGDHAPVAFDPGPGLALAARPVGARALELGVGGGEVAPESGDHRVRQAALRRAADPADAERLDRLYPVQVLAWAVADDVRALPEKRVERGQVVGHQRRLVTGEGRLHLDQDLRVINLHGSTIAAWERPAASSSAAARRARSSRQGGATSW